MTKENKRQRKVLNGKYSQNLQLKELMDKVLEEGTDLSAPVRQAANSLRDDSWREFVAEQEKTMKSEMQKQTQSSILKS